MPNQIVVRPPFRRRGQAWLPLSRSSVRGVITGSGGIRIGGDIGEGARYVDRQVASDVVVEWDFDNDGDFDDPLEDITSYVLSLETQTGRDWPSHLTGTAGPGTLKASLRNDGDLFSYFNATSPLTQGDFSLDLGRKLRVRTREASNPDPVLLARDRFQRAAGALVVTENGIPWITDPDASGTFEISDGRAVVTATGGGTHVALLDIVADTFYIQASCSYQDFDDGPGLNNAAGLYLRYQNFDNNLRIEVFNASIILRERVGGVNTTLDTTTAETLDGLTVGALVDGGEVTVYIDGVPRFTATSSFTEGRVGIRGAWSVQRAPAIDEFHMWDGVPAEVEGILWTGDVTELVTAVSRGPDKVATLTGKGWLSRAAQQEISPPTSVGPTSVAGIVYPGKRTGQLVGQTLAAAGLLHPPGPIDHGDITCGGVGLDDAKALDIARLFEETELGFLFETQEGPIGFRDRNTPNTEPHSGCVLSDAPGAQFGYHNITPYDWRREIVNRVQAGVAPSTPRLKTRGGYTDLTAAGVNNSVIIDVFDASNDGAVPGDLLIALISASVRTDGEEWITPDGWTSLRDTKDKAWQHVYAKILTDDDLGTQVTVYADAGNSGGGAVVTTYLIGGWFGDLNQGLQMAPHNSVIGNSAFTGSSDPPAVFPSWDGPSLFLTTRAGLVSFGGASVSAETDVVVPNGYFFKRSQFVNSAANGQDVAQQSAIRVGVAEVENPSRFGATFGGFVFSETTVLAVRGYEGTLSTSQGAQRQIVEVNDLDSQDSHGGLVRTHTNAANLFRAAADARDYGQLVLARYAGDRPIFAVSFWATKSAAYRNQAKRRRVGDRITLVAAHQSGLGVDSDYFIESIGHRFDQGATAWEVTWELSPVPADPMRPDTEGSELTDAINATQTEFEVTTTVGDVWINSEDRPSMFPFDVTIGAETIRVVGIDGDTSPQTFQVDRAVNQNPQSHSAGASVVLTKKWIAA